MAEEDGAYDHLAKQGRMGGRWRPSWCPSCGAPPGMDCYDIGRTARDERRAAKRGLASSGVGQGKGPQQ